MWWKNKERWRLDERDRERDRERERETERQRDRLKRDIDEGVTERWVKYDIIKGILMFPQTNWKIVFHISAKIIIHIQTKY